MRSPAREASAASSSDASNAVSMRGSSAMRAAEVRPESTTSTTRRSRSGRQVRTTSLTPPLAGSRRRAVARQSSERTSSPRTYSRSESNSVPCPRTITLVRPSSSRSRASRDGRCLRDANGGSTRIDPATADRRLARRDPQRAERAHGHVRGPALAAAHRGQRGRDDAALAGAAGRTARRVGRAPADGCQASRRMPCTVRRPPFVTNRSAGDRFAEPHPRRDLAREPQRSRRAGDDQVDGRPARTTQRQPEQRRPGQPPSSTTGTVPTASSATNQPETAIG